MLILAHRGLPGPDRPENTLAAVAAAFDGGADGVEVDLRLTADGVLALSHDPDLERLTGTATPVADTPWPVLRRGVKGAGARLARVEELLVLADGRPVVLELKAPSPAPGADTRTAEALVATLRSMRTAGTPLDVRVSSFSPDLLGTVHGLLERSDDVSTALLGPPDEAATSVLRRAVADGHDQIHPHVGSLLADPRVAHEARTRGMSVVAWTVNSPLDVRRCAQLGLHAVITDDPAAARTAMETG